MRLLVEVRNEASGGRTRSDSDVRRESAPDSPNPVCPARGTLTPATSGILVGAHPLAHREGQRGDHSLPLAAEKVNASHLHRASPATHTGHTRLHNIGATHDRPSLRRARRLGRLSPQVRFPPSIAYAMNSPEGIVSVS